jgi:hypothetical protein
MVREFDHLNVYTCARPNSCLHSKKRAPGFVGPASAFLECEDESSLDRYPVQVWNPIYDKNTPAPTTPDRPPLCHNTFVSFSERYKGIWRNHEDIILSVILIFGGFAIFFWIRNKQIK